MGQVTSFSLSIMTFAILLDKMTVRHFVVPKLRLTPCIAKSREYSLIKVVLPLPVGPVKTVNSPLLCPNSILFNVGNLFHLTPCTCQKITLLTTILQLSYKQKTLSTLSRSDQTSLLKLLKVVILRCQTTWAPFSTALKSCSGCKCGRGSLGRTTAHRFSPSFLVKCLAESQALLSLPNHNMSFLNRSKLGRTY